MFGRTFMLMTSHAGRTGRPLWGWPPGEAASVLPLRWTHKRVCDGQMCSLMRTEPGLWEEHWHMLLMAWIAALEESIFLYLMKNLRAWALWPCEWGREWRQEELSLLHALLLRWKMWKCKLCLETCERQELLVLNYIQITFQIAKRAWFSQLGLPLIKIAILFLICWVTHRHDFQAWIYTQIAWGSCYKGDCDSADRWPRGSASLASSCRMLMLLILDSYLE